MKLSSDLKMSLHTIHRSSSGIGAIKMTFLSECKKAHEFCRHAGGREQRIMYSQVVVNVAERVLE